MIISHSYRSLSRALRARPFISSDPSEEVNVRPMQTWLSLQSKARHDYVVMSNYLPIWGIPMFVMQQLGANHRSESRRYNQFNISIWNRIDHRVYTGGSRLGSKTQFVGTGDRLVIIGCWWLCYKWLSCHLYQRLMDRLNPPNSLSVLVWCWTVLGLAYSRSARYPVDLMITEVRFTCPASQRRRKARDWLDEERWMGARDLIG